MDGHRGRMGLKVFLLASWLFLGGAFRIEVVDNENNSPAQNQTISMQTREFRVFTDTAKLLNQFLGKSVVIGQQTQDKAKSEPGESEESMLKDILSMQRKMMESQSLVLKYLDNGATPLTRPADCSDILFAGQIESGVYEIYPTRCRWSKSVKVFCDMKTDGGGWTVFLLRNNISKPVNFTRNWEDYKNGFGDPSTEYWLGNEHLHTLTFNRNYTLRLELKDTDGSEIWGQWNSFSVDSEQNKFKLTSTNVDPLSTVDGDYFAHHNSMFFSTFDRDNDKYSGSCAELGKGGWWYNACYFLNPTVERLRFQDWPGFSSVAQWIQLKIRPSICAAQISTASLNTHN